MAMTRIRLLIIFIFIIMFVGCSGEKTVEKYSPPFKKEDFLNLKSGTLYDEVIAKYDGPPIVGWYKLEYPVGNKQNVILSFGYDQKLQRIHLQNSDNSVERYLEWEEREKKENGGKANTPHKKKDFINIKRGESVEEIIKRFGEDFFPSGSGRMSLRYMVEDYNYILIRFDTIAVDTVELISFNGETTDFIEWMKKQLEE